MFGFKSDNFNPAERISTLFKRTHFHVIRDLYLTVGFVHVYYIFLNYFILVHLHFLLT